MKRLWWIFRVTLYAQNVLIDWTFRECWNVAAVTHDSLDDADREDPVTAMIDEFDCWDG